MSFEIQRYDSNASNEFTPTCMGERNERQKTTDGKNTDGSEEEYIDPSTNDLTIITGAALIVADCMGTGILALPYDINITLGMGFGLFFLILNVFINLYAGTILCNVALLVERRLSGSYGSIIDGSSGDNHDSVTNNDDCENDEDGNGNGTIGVPTTGNDTIDWNYDDESDNQNNDVRSDDNHDAQKEDTDQEEMKQIQINSPPETERYQTMTRENVHNDHDECENLEDLKTPISDNQSNTVNERSHDSHGSAHTFDFIGMTYALFDHPSHEQQQQQKNQHEMKSQSLSKATVIVTITYYINIFLVLGNYILVMSHAVAAMLGESNICLPSAGLVASTLMFGLSQLRSMTSLGHIVSFVSLAALAVVVLQCLISIQSGNDSFKYEEDKDQGSFGGGERFLYMGRLFNQEHQRQIDEYQGEESEDGVNHTTMFQSLSRQFAALSSIGFAVGSQKVSLIGSVLSILFQDYIS